MNVIDELTNDQIIELINEMYDYRIKNGTNSDCPKLRKLYNDYQNFHSEDMLYQYILNEASVRFDKVVIELFLKHPDKFLRIQ